MKILCLNRGSSSVKCCIYDFQALPKDLVAPVWEKQIEKKGWASWILDQEFDVVGHRIVHGGRKYRKSILIDEEVKQEIRKLSELAPLHNLEDLEGIETIEKHFPKISQVAVFDTSFHHTLPKEAAVYPGPYEWFKKGIQRYGFHGISFQYCTQRAFTLLEKKISKMVICHLGSGASLCAVKEGRSIDTTMGFTPLEGLMMDTRSGTIDPGILLYLLKEKSVEELSQELYEKSGLLGLSGGSADMRDILKQNNERSQLAIEVYLHRLISMIGSMIASMGGIDVLVFTGGIGENASLIREKVCERFSFLGMHLGQSELLEDGILSSIGSKVQILLIHTQEAFEIAKECWKVIR